MKFARRALLVFLLACAAPAAFAQADDPATSQAPLAPPAQLIVRPDPKPRALALEAGSGQVLHLPAPAANVFVVDPKVAEVRPGSATSLFVFGVGAGRTTVAAMDAAGSAIALYQVTVRPSGYLAGEADLALARLLPQAQLHVIPQAHGVLLTGHAHNPGEAARAVAIVQGFLAPGDPIENQVAVEAAGQVNLRVRIIEMSRTVSRAIGVDWQALGSLGSFTTAFGLPTSGITTTAAKLVLGSKDVNALIDALAQDNLVHVLAEPNLTVMSGEPGSFLVGGEFPVPVAEQGNTIAIEFKKYGVALRFVPTVLSDGRINLHVSPEVSELSQQGAIQLTASNATVSIPALTVRRAETSVELGSGQSFAMAGLLQDSVSDGASGIPMLGDVPILGALFRSTAFQRQETELVIMVTPYVVRPVDDPSALKSPDEHYGLPNDLERILMLRQVARGPAVAPTRIPGQAGFIVQ